MGMMDKLKFWKKKSALEALEEELDQPAIEKHDFDQREHHDFGTEKHHFGETTTSFHEEEEPPLAPPARPHFNTPPPQAQGFSPYIQKDIQLILSKLETIQARLENMDRRLQIIEEVIHNKPEKKQTKEWY